MVVRALGLTVLAQAFALRLDVGLGQDLGGDPDRGLLGGVFEDENHFVEVVRVLDELNDEILRAFDLLKN